MSSLKVDENANLEEAEAAYTAWLEDVELRYIYNLYTDVSIIHQYTACQLSLHQHNKIFKYGGFIIFILIKLAI